MAGQGLNPQGLGGSDNVGPSESASITTDQAIIGSNEYDIVEDGNGDLVIRDDAGNDVFIWDKSAGQWDFKSQDLSNIASVTTDQVFTNSKEAKVVIKNEGGTYIADGQNGEVDRGSDVGAVIQSALNSFSEGLVVLRDNSYVLSSSFSPGNRQGVIGERQATLTCDTAISEMVKIGSSSNYPNEIALKNLNFNGDNNATAGVLVESGQRHELHNVTARNVTTGIHIKNTNTSSNLHMLDIQHCFISDVDIGIKAETTVSGTAVADSRIENVFVRRPTTGGILCQDTPRIRVITCYVANNGTEFDYGYKLRHSGTFGNPVKGAIFDGIYTENQNVTTPAWGFIGEIANGGGNIESTDIRNIGLHTPGANWLKLDNPDDSADLRHTSIKHFDNTLTANADGDNILIGASSGQRVSGTRVHADGVDWGELDDAITDNGRWSVINGLGKRSLSGGSPNTDLWNRGDIVEDTDNPGTVHLITGDSSSTSI